MAMMKQIGIAIAKCIYEQKMSIDETVKSTAATWGIEDKEWLRKQVEHIATSKVYKELSSHG